ncbi:MAG: hypothetical protein RR540_05555, partial [Oscillospiraceae bacterium]
MSNTVSLRNFPAQYVKKFKETNSELIRLDTARNCLAAEELDINPCFLSEAENVKSGQEYSAFEVN